MPKNLTLDDFILRFRNRGGYRNSTVFTDVIITEFVNSAMCEVWDLLVNTWEDYYLKEDTSFMTMNGVEQYGLPSDFYKLRRVEIQEGAGATSRFRKLRPAGLERLNRLRDESGEPIRYHLRGVNNAAPPPDFIPVIVLAPTPVAAQTLRYTYIPVAQQLVSGTDTWDGINGYDELVTQRALLKADMRENVMTTEREREIARLEQRVISSAPSRDAGEPVRMSDHVEGVVDEFDFLDEWIW